MTLRCRITLVAVFVTLLVAATLIATAQIAQNEIERRFTEATTTAKTVLWKKITASQLDAMESQVSTLARDRDTRKALKSGNYSALPESASTAFNLLSTSRVLSRLQITDLEGQVVFSAPRVVSAKTVKTLATEALKEGATKRGLERDDDGTLVAEVAFPLYSRGKVIGTGVYMRELEEAVAEFKLNDDSEVFIVSTSGREEYATTDQMLSRLDVSHSQPDSSTVEVTRLDDRYYAVTVVPILNSAGAPVARLISAKDYTESYASQQNINTVAYAIAVIVLIFALGGLYFYMNRSLKPLQKVVSSLEEIAAGDLTGHIEVESSDEIGQLQAAMQATAQRLNNMVAKINDMTTQLSASANSMTSITEGARTGSEQQLGEVEMVATAINEMTATVHEVASNTALAADAAARADEESQNGSQVVEKTIASIKSLADEVEDATSVIGQLNEDTDSIGGVLDVIRGIAEQTNLLALNAAIEAARAGDQGRGFAVVADEVRSLAGRTQQSTAEIQEMIERLRLGAQKAVEVMQTSHEQAQASVSQAGEAGSSLQAITQAVTHINDMNVQIASAAEEQNAVTEEINRNVVNINQLADQGADRSQQISLATDEVNQLVTQLESLVSQFKV